MLNPKMIGKKIADARKKMNIPQSQLAEQLFISSQAVGKWERGESMPDIITLNRLAEILGLDLNYFSEGGTSAPNEAIIAESPQNQSTEPESGKKKKKLSWDMSRGNWADADFSGLNNLHEKFSSSNMQRCLFIGSELSGLLLKRNNVDGCDFSGSDISSSHFQSSNLGNNKFRGCKLDETEFSETNIENCDFSGAGLTSAKFSQSFITGCDFTGADLTDMIIKSGGFVKNIVADVVLKHTSFIDTHISDIDFEGKVEDCYFENCSFSRVTFRNSTFINTFFKNKSLKRIQFIDCKADRMTYAFLKNGKADLTGITLQM